MLGGTFFKAISETHFSEKWCQMEPQIAPQMYEHLVKNETWNYIKKQAKNVLVPMPLDLRKSSYSVFLDLRSPK